MDLMGSKSVRYHAETVMGRSDDHRGRALEYYGSRGETPLRWGGSGARSLGLEGTVMAHQYASIYGEGGAKEPLTGERLVSTKRPGMEIVIAAHKSVAELGVIGRADDMHAILDAERDATIGYLDDLTRRRGGRRGVAAVPVSTTGLIYAHSRHATSRAGDPSPHDHVLLANLVEMLDEKGGFKAPDTSLWRDHLHAATMYGRMAAARKATELGYAIEADPGPSGKLGHFRIAGVPKEVCDLHSKRASEIDVECLRTGHSSYRARALAARSTRAYKRHTPIADLMGRWNEEIEAAGYSDAEIRALVYEAACRRRRVRPLDHEHLRRDVDWVLGADGPLARKKVFSRADVIVALAPKLYGQEPKVLTQLVTAALSDPETIPLLGVQGAKEQVYTTARTLVTEEAIAEAIGAQMARTNAPCVERTLVAEAVSRIETELGKALTSSQREAIAACTGSGRGAEIMIGVAGAGKTTALNAIAEAFERSGCSVIGTATSGQAAKALSEEAEIGFARTLASIIWRIDHGQLALSERHVVILDEASMTDDRALLRLLGAAEDAGSKVLLVGDHLQLGPVGPGGAFEALFDRHRPEVHVLSENVRQRDAEERIALAQLRAGEVSEAVGFYVGRGHVRTAGTRHEALDRAVEAFSADYLAGREVVLLAWRRANVAELNARARKMLEEAGGLCGPELEVPGGRRYCQGDKVVFLAPENDLGITTSERATVVSVHERHNALTLQKEDGRLVCVGGELISAERLDHSYAMTVHRMQGATTEVSHLYCDGGGRELAYVAMSRAKEASFVYCVADDTSQAQEDLRREWSASKRPHWASALGWAEGAAHRPVADAPKLLPEQAAAVRLAQLKAQRERVTGAMPADPGKELAEVNAYLVAERHALSDLEEGRGRWKGTEVERAADARYRAQRELERAKANRAWAKSDSEHRYWSEQVEERHTEFDSATRRYEALADPTCKELASRTDSFTKRLQLLEQQKDARDRWIEEHPEAPARLARIDAEIVERSTAIERGRPSSVRDQRTSRAFTAGRRARTGTRNADSFGHESARPSQDRRAAGRGR